MNFRGAAVSGVILKLRTVGGGKNAGGIPVGDFVVSGNRPGGAWPRPKSHESGKRSKYAFKTRRLSDNTPSGDFSQFPGDISIWNIGRDVSLVAVIVLSSLSILYLLVCLSALYASQSRKPSNSSHPSQPSLPRRPGHSS